MSSTTIEQMLAGMEPVGYSFTGDLDLFPLAGTVWRVPTAASPKAHWQAKNNLSNYKQHVTRNSILTKGLCISSW